MGRSVQRRPLHGPAVRGWTQRLGPGAVSGAGGPPCLQGPACSGTPPLSKPGWGPVRGCRGWDTLVGRRAPPSALRASQALLTKLHFEINSVVAGASEGYGCHGDRAKEEAPGWPGLGQGVRALLQSPRPACREGQGRLAQLSPGFCLLIPPECKCVY